jgi:glycosyltransferase involved in cell wall biosynthesis
MMGERRTRSGDPQGSDRPLRVCYFGTYRAEYSRNRIMMAGLRACHVEVIECHVRLWQGVSDRVQAASGGWLRPSFILRVVRAYWHLLKMYRRAGDYDVMVLGYPGQLDVFLARLLTWVRHKPLVLDVFMSLYLIADERGLNSRHPLTANLLYRLEKAACQLPDRLILDTAEYIEWFREVYGFASSRFCLVPTGADDATFHPMGAHGRHDGFFQLLYHGSFIPNHGVEVIVEAARILQGDATIQFELIGAGPTMAPAMDLAARYGLKNVFFRGWATKQELPAKIAETDVCLGVFGTTPQSMMTIQNKIYESLAMGKPLLTGESPTVRAAFVDGKHLLLCRRESPASLAEAIVRLKGDPDLCARLSEQGYARFAREYSIDALGRRIRTHLDAVVKDAE